MTPIACGWVMVFMVAVLASATSLHIPNRWRLWPYVLTRTAILMLPSMFTGWALAQMGVYLLGGAS